MTEIEKLVEECARDIEPGRWRDYDMEAANDPEWAAKHVEVSLRQARAVIARTLEYAAGEADKHRALVPDHDPDKPVPDAVGQGYGNAALNLAAAYRFAARSLPKAEGEDGSTLPKAE